MGICVREITLTMSSAESGAVYPILGPNITEKDFDEARFIIILDTCTTLDLEGYYLYEEGHVSDEYDDDDSNYEDRHPFFALAEFGVVTTVATALKTAVEVSMREVSTGEG